MLISSCGHALSIFHKVNEGRDGKRGDNGMVDKKCLMGSVRVVSRNWSFLADRARIWISGNDGLCARDGTSIDVPSLIPVYQPRGVPTQLGLPKSGTPPRGRPLQLKPAIRIMPSHPMHTFLSTPKFGLIGWLIMALDHKNSFTWITNGIYVANFSRQSCLFILRICDHYRFHKPMIY